jgi:hypothetical protein
MCLATRRVILVGMTEEKQCRTCLLVLPYDRFHKDTGRKDGRATSCRLCFNANTRANYDPVKKKSQHLKYLYGITLEEYNSKLEQQGGGCAVCGIKIPGGNGKNFYVDHNHTTGQVRDLLCHNCNFVIGYAKEDVDILKAVIQYLEIWRD